MKNKFLTMSAMILMYADEPTVPSGSAPDTTSGGGGGDTVKGDAGDKIVFTPEQQAEVNRILANDRRKNADSNKLASKKLIDQLESAKAAAHTSATEKVEIQNQIDQLKATFQTTEEQLKERLDGWEKKYNGDTANLTKDRDTWRVRHDTNLKRVDIAQAAVKHKAVSTGQIEAMLLPLTSVIEELDADQKKTGNFISSVQFPTVDKEGKPVKLTLSVDAAVKKMTEIPDLYGNLFQNGAAPGAGSGQGNRTSGSNGIPDLDSMNPADYAKNRDSIVKQLRASQTST